MKKNNRSSTKRGFNPSVTKTNVVEHRQSSKNKKTKAKLKIGLKGGVSKNKFQGKCFNCGKVGHRSVDCRLLRKNNKNHETNVVDNITHNVSDINLFVVSEVNLV